MSTLEERFANLIAGLPKQVGETPKDLVLAFIKSEIEQAKLEAREEVRKIVKLMEIYDNDDTSRTVVNMHGYNDAIKDILSHLQSPVALESTKEIK